MNKDQDQATNDEYLGNIWGWKFSFVGLGLIVFFLVIMWYRHSRLGIPFGGSAVDTQESTNGPQMNQDSILVKED